MAVPVSANLERCKSKNQKEQTRLQNELSKLMSTERTSIHEMDRERIQLLQQLQINRCKALRTSLQQGMLLRDRISLMSKDMHLNKRKKATLSERSKGFSKITIDDDENDRNMYYTSLRRSKTQSAYTSGVKQPTFTITDNDIFVHYPTPENKRMGKSIITVAELKSMRGQPINLSRINNYSSVQRPHTVSGVTRSNYPKPKYVSKLEILANKDFDQYTDGTMHLEERKFQQRQREFLPQISGHLPVRRRRNSDSANQLHIVLDDSKVLNLPPKNIKVYVPKSARADRDSEDRNEQKRFLKLKQEHQATQYATVLGLTAGFLGKQPSSLNMVKHPDLTKEETVMFSHVKKKLPSFRVAVTVVKWLTASLKRASAISEKKKQSPRRDSSSGMSIPRTESRSVTFDETDSVVIE